MLHAATVLVLVLVIALAGTLSLGARAVNNTNENRLLRQRAIEVGAVLGAILPIVLGVRWTSEADRAEPWAPRQ